MLAQAEISLYALGERDMLPVIYDFVKRLERPGLKLELGPMSSLICGDAETVFNALRDAYLQIADQKHKNVIVVKIMNLPEPAAAPAA